MKEYHAGKKCLSPSIFRKAKGPLIVGTTFTSPPTSASSESTLKSMQNGGKKADGLGMAKEFN